MGQREDEPRDDHEHEPAEGEMRGPAAREDATRSEDTRRRPPSAASVTPISASNRRRAAQTRETRDEAER